MDQVKVGIMNSSKEITDVLSEIFEQEGYVTSVQFTYKFKKEVSLFDSFIEAEEPQVIVYDISLPYDDNFALFKKLSHRDSAKDIPFILTSSNKKALEGFVGPTNTHELIGKPYDLEEIVGAVKRALETRKSI